MFSKSAASKISLFALTLVLLATLDLALSGTLRVSRTRGARQTPKQSCIAECELQGEKYMWCYITWTKWDYCDKRFDDPVLELKKTKDGRNCTSTCGLNGHHYEWCYVGISSWGYCTTNTLRNLLKGDPRDRHD